MSLLPIALLSAAVTAMPYIPADDLKCGRTERTVPHYIVDGVFLVGPDAPEGSVTPDIRREDLLRIDVLCWDPVRRVLQTGFGEPVIVLTTKQFMATLQEDMERVVAAQDAFRAKHGSFTGMLSDLDVDIATPGLDVSITTSRAGWSATAGGELMRVRCRVFAGSIEPPHHSLEPRVPVCTAP